MSHSFYFLIAPIALLAGVAIFCISSFYANRARKNLIREQMAARAAFEKSLEQERIAAHLKIQDDHRRARQELDRLHAKLAVQHENFIKKEARLDEQRAQLDARILQQHDYEARLVEEKKRIAITLESIAQLSRDEARLELIQTLKDEAHSAAHAHLIKIEDEAREKAKERSAEILISVMQRYTAEQVNQTTVGSVHLPNEEMKGKIIGKEGRNIKALEMATGMEFIIGDAPEVITISGFNPIRREIARRALEKLVLDGRINPTRIEETVEQVEREIEEIIEEYGRKTVLQFRLHSVKSEVVSTLGKLHFRTSFSQNVLQHSMEVALFARMIAEELGCDRPEIALRAGLLHDIGKALSAELEGPHALIGAELAKRCGEDPLVVNAIAAHHEEVPFQSIYAPIVMIADTISACRPGARRETLTTYIKRLEKLEELAHNFHGVKRAYAVQAGREVRVIVEESILSDEGAHFLARDLARKIEEDMAFPGQIKVNVIREKRSIEYAR